MGRIYACVGRYAANPYTIKKACIKVYCVEELCYYIRNNAFFVDEDFFDTDLFSWLEEECDLAGLAKNLRLKYRQEKKMELVVRLLFETVHYCDEKEIEETVVLLQTNRNMPGKQRLRMRGDYLLKNNKNSVALQTYEDLIERLDLQKEKEAAGAVFHNMGVIYARMFLFEEAAVYFNKAYETDGKREHMVAYLSTFRIRMSDESYLRRIREFGNEFEATSLLENRLEQALSEYKNSDDYLRIKGIEHLHSDGNIQAFNKAMDGQLEYFKNTYRSLLEH